MREAAANGLGQLIQRVITRTHHHDTPRGAAPIQAFEGQGEGSGKAALHARLPAPMPPARHVIGSLEVA